MQFDLTINLGNVLTLGSILVFIGSAWRMLKGHHEWIKSHQECTRQHVAVLTEVRTALSYLQGRFDQKKQEDE
jgi:hypothetical protein